jgi:hypothetical protein
MKRQHVLLGVLLLALGAAWWAAGLDESDEQPPRRTARKTIQREAVVHLDVAGLTRAGRAVESDGPNLFPVRSFLPPPLPPPAPAAPVAPPLPFRYSGMLEDGGAPAAFLASGEQIRVVRAGDVLDGRYRVTALSRSRIDFIYLPLNESQSLMTGAMP